jgi:hypothetical protein
MAMTKPTSDQITFLNTVTLPGDLAVNGGDITTTSATANVVNATATTVNIGGAATAMTIGATTGTTTVRNDLSLSTGNLIIGTSGKGIDFSATSDGSGTMTSELLDDYEEGTWSPVYSPTTGSFTTMTMDVVSATYTKVGRLVTLCAFIRTDNVNASGASGSVNITGLPFAVPSNELTGLLVGYAGTWATAPTSGYIFSSGNAIRLAKPGSSNNTVDLAVADVTTGATADRNELVISMSYFTA